MQSVAQLRIKHYSTFYRRLVVCLVLITLLGLIIGLKVRSHRQKGSNTQPAAIKLEGEEATRFLETSSGSSLTQALNNERFKLSWNDHSPFGEQSGGYLALSHEQNINAWFDDGGVTIRPTGSDPKNKWTFGMKLKAYGYANQMITDPVLKNVSTKGTRIEYERQAAIGTRQSKITEWYENGSAGIEQGFTLDERPATEEGSSENLKLIVSVTGDLRTLMTSDGNKIELINDQNEKVLTYGQLTAVDATSRRLPAHLETNKDANELILVVDDREAIYPIVIDPITASEQAKLAAILFNAGGRFGFSVAIQGDLAIIGAPTTDLSIVNVDTGRAYVFARSGSTWTLEQEFNHPTLFSDSLRCGYSVDIGGIDPVSRGLLMIYGCPGFQTTKGSAVVLSRTAPNTYTTVILDDPLVRPGDRFGAYVSMDSNDALVGAPFYDFDPTNDTNNGAVFLFTVNGTQMLSSTKFEGEITPQLNDQFGSDVAIARNTGGGTFVVGEPNADGFLPGTTILNRGAAHVYTKNASGTYDVQTLIASDFAADDSFGFSVAISGNTIAVGAPFDDNEKGANAGSVYIFRKKNSGIWEQEAKLVASDGFANDQFSYFGLGINNSTVVVGSHFADGPNFPFDPNDNRGEAYIFTTVNNRWTEESRIRASDGAPGDEFGLAIDLDEFNSLIIGAPNHDIVTPVGPVADIGFAYVYQLSCPSVPAPAIEVTAGTEPFIRTDSITLCENTRPVLNARGGELPGQTYQWRRNGVNIPGATSLFLFKFFTAADAGTYDVVVSNSCSSRISPPIVVNVNSSCNVTPLSQTLPSTPGGGSLNVTACGECYWGATPFENPTSFGFRLTNVAGRGNGILNFTVTRNPYPLPRTVEYEIAGQRALITQSPSPNFVVTDGSSANFGGTLQDIVTRANETAGDDVITFDLLGAGPHFVDLFNTVRIRGNLKIVNDRIGDKSVTVRPDPVLGAFRVFEIDPNVNVSMSGLTISDGKAGDDGSAILNNGGRLSLRNCTIRNNTTDAGAAVQNNGGILEVNNCTFINNTGIAGGALINRPINGNAAVAVVNNSTFNGNKGVLGGAINNGTGDVPGYLTIRNSTFSNNDSLNGASVYNNGVLTTVNTIYRRGTGNSIVNHGTITSLGHNLSDDAAGGDGGTAAGGFLNGPFDIRNTNPNLGPLIGNGGPTLTHALIAPSAAINGGDDSVMSAPFNLLTDQGGFLRKSGSSVDIGALESGSTAGPAVQFSTVNYSGSEGDSRIELILTRVGDSSVPVNVSYATTDKGSGNSCDAVSDLASSRCDYLSALGTVRLNPGETTKVISILVIDDVIRENSEKLSIDITDVKGARIGPQSRAEITITDNETTNPPNPISQPIFFVRQHYLDFLNREPDSGGLNFWSNEITSCGSNQQCIELKRINVSAAFFLSIEFQETGYLVYRSYKSAFGNLPGKPVPITLNDFLRDTQEIGKNVVVGAPGWQAQLESNKQAFVLAFVNRPEFIAAFANALTADQFVTQMNNNAGGVLSTTEKANLVALLGPTPFDPVKRAQVLRAVADDSDLRAAEFNKAFVLMQYFGYLRRNPNDFPDSDFGGYNFWLGKLNQFNGNFVNADMVKAFIVSGEYKHRFGP